jgi:uncharacterized protein (TIGR02001 family)
MKTRLLVLGMVSATALLGTSVTAFADGEAAAPANPWSATLAVTSDYRFRGISQSDNNPAIQGSIDFAGSQGIIAGVWASNVDFNDNTTDYEVDLYAGYTHAFSDSTEGTAKVVYYVYPGSDADIDYLEIIGSLSHTMGRAGLSVELAYSPDYINAGYSSLAVTGGLEYALAESASFFDGGISASGHVGRQTFDDATALDYTFYDIGVSGTVGMLTLDVRYVATDLDEAECGTEWCNSGVVVTGTLSFGG